MLIVDDLLRRSQMLEALDRVCDQFEREFRTDQSPRIEDFLLTADPALRANWRRCLLEIELELRCQRGDKLQLDIYLSRFPDAPEAVFSAFAAVCPAVLELSE